MQLFYNFFCECQKKVVPLQSQRMPTGTLNYNIDIWAQSVAPLNKRSLYLRKLFISRQFEFLAFLNTARRSRDYVGFLRILEPKGSRDPE